MLRLVVHESMLMYTSKVLCSVREVAQHWAPVQEARRLQLRSEVKVNKLTLFEQSRNAKNDIKINAINISILFH